MCNFANMRGNKLTGAYLGELHKGYGGRYQGEFIHHRGYGHRASDAFTSSKYTAQGHGVFGNLLRTAVKTVMSSGKTFAKGALSTARKSGKHILKTVLGKTPRKYVKKHLGKIAKSTANAVMAEAGKALKSKPADSSSKKLVKKQIAKHIMPAVKSFLSHPSKSGRAIKGHKKKRKKLSYVGTHRTKRSVASRLQGRSTIF
jgi:hypothetical protein